MTSPGPADGGRQGRRTARKSAARRRRRRIIGIVIAIVMIPVLWSYVHAVTGPGTEGIGAKSVEWIRSHGGAPIVKWVENEWYSFHKPPVGGKPSVSALPPFFSTFSVPTLSDEPSTTPPATMAPIAGNPIPGEGIWHPQGRLVGGKPALYTAFLRSDPQRTSIVAGVAWMDSKLLKATLFAGSQAPGGTGWKNVAPTTQAENLQLVAEFNSGFLMADSGGGYYSEGRTFSPLQNGHASYVIFTDGTSTVAQWGRDVTMSPNIASVRQNLDLIVDGGTPVPGLANASTSQWGNTLGNAVYVWRSGVGVTADGAIVYVGGPNLTAYNLANVLVHAGAVRGMELDINTDWVNFFYYSPQSGQPASPSNGTKLLPEMVQPVSRYFNPSTRDFVAMFAAPPAYKPSTPTASKPTTTTAPASGRHASTTTTPTSAHGASHTG